MSDLGMLQQRYRRLFGIEPAAPTDFLTIERSLNLELPEDFKAIARFYRGGFLGGKSHHSTAVVGPATNVHEETIRLRKAITLPKHFVAIAESAASLIVMTCLKGDSRVIWCDATDATKLERADELRQPQVWPNYAVFFEWLLDEEENERAEPDA
ncbi:MAG: SMI1/KNR4 family protein [Limisphaerales bacterium]